MSVFKAVARLKSNTNKAHRQKAWGVRVFPFSFWKSILRSCQATSVLQLPSPGAAPQAGDTGEATRTPRAAALAARGRPRAAGPGRSAAPVRKAAPPPARRGGAAPENLPARSLCPAGPAPGPGGPRRRPGGARAPRPERTERPTPAGLAQQRPRRLCRPLPARRQLPSAPHGGSHRQSGCRAGLAAPNSPPSSATAQAVPGALPSGNVAGRATGRRSTLKCSGTARLQPCKRCQSCRFPQLNPETDAADEGTSAPSVMLLPMKNEIIFAFFLGESFNHEEVMEEQDCQ
ncbi:uncharacterized protein LOC129124086 [Agelaius phoeniceus]|uniref:uncharacterized protein LOC129124086 n=1 Tax=Agelaius phoeniceus TaxID=39638 RepID=UPI004054B81C